MNLDQLTIAHFTPLFRRLLVAYQHRIPETWLEETIRTYYQVIRRYDVAIVEKAFEHLINDPETKYFPKANQVGAVCRRFASETKRAVAIQHHDHEPTCPDCQSVYTWQTWYVERFGPHAKPTDFTLADGSTVPLHAITKRICQCAWDRVQSRWSEIERAVSS